MSPICIEYIHLCVVAVHELQFQNKVVIIPANVSPGILELIVQLSGRELSQRVISRNTWVSQGGISKFICRVWETGRAIERPHGHWLRMTTARRDHAPIRIMRRKRFISLSRIGVELIRRIGHRVSAHTAVQKRLVAFAYRSRRPARCPKLTQDHRHCLRVWAHRHLNWNHQPWSHVIFADKSRGGDGMFIYVSGYNIRQPITTSNKCSPLHNNKNNNTNIETFIHEISPIIGTYHRYQIHTS